MSDTKASPQMRDADHSGTVQSLPLTWARARQEGIAIEQALGLKINGKGIVRKISNR